MTGKPLRTRAVVLGCHKSGLGVIRALGKSRVPVVGVYYHNNDMGYVSRYVEKKYQCPNPDKDESGFVEFLLDKVNELEGSVLIPSDDGTLIAVSKNKKELEKYYRVSACDWEIIEKVISKQYTYSLAEEIEVPCPRSYNPGNEKEAIEFASQIGYPCLLKPKVGHLYFEISKRKMVMIHTEEQLKEEYHIADVHNMKMMVQEMIPGDDTSGVNYNSFFADGKSVIEFTAEKVRLSPPKFGFPRVVVTKDIPVVKNAGRELLKAIGYDGFACIEFKKDSRNGIYKLMEINGRQNLSSILAVKCGINFPYISFMYALSGEIPSFSNDYVKGVYWIDFEKDVIESIRSAKVEGYSMGSILKPYFKSHVFAVVSFKDPLPILKRFYDLFRSIGIRIGETFRRGSEV